MVPDPAERIALVEAAFRIANERMAAWEEVPDDQRALYFCECGVRDCHERVALSRPEYEAIRADPRHFAVMPGHALEDVEDVIASHEGYDVIEKPDAVWHVVSAADPRRPGDGPMHDEAQQLADDIPPDPRS